MVVNEMTPAQRVRLHPELAEAHIELAFVLPFPELPSPVGLVF